MRSTPPRNRDPLRPLEHPWPTGVAGAAVLIVVVLVGLLVAHATAWDRYDIQLLQWFSGHRTAALSAVALGIAWLFSPPMAVALTTASGIAVAVVTRSIPRTATFMLMVAVCWGGSEVIKHIVQRPRAAGTELWHPLVLEESFSYPSGHTCFIAALGIAVVFLLRNRRRAFWLAVACTAVAVLVVAWSRMYIGVHYPTDVTASVVYALASMALFLAVWLSLILPRLRRSR